MIYILSHSLLQVFRNSTVLCLAMVFFVLENIVCSPNENVYGFDWNHDCVDVICSDEAPYAGVKY